MWVEIIIHGKLSIGNCHPLREDVSWNSNTISHIITQVVILFVRMWVEIICDRLNIFLPVSSSSSWGCELKYWCSRCGTISYCHPLREDVSWNVKLGEFQYNFLVILFVRMWVEIFTNRPDKQTYRVILFVRMWVEIIDLLKLYFWRKSSSSWGCELKYQEKKEQEKWKGHPLREDVSWNTMDITRQIRQHRHPLREDVSWNVIENIIALGDKVILFVRMWVEMFLWTVGC